jgi:endo-1,4-beta-xylanase
MMYTHLSLGLLLVRAATGVGAQQQQPAQPQGLHSLFVAAGKLFFGTATDTNLFNDIPYLTIANNSNEFGLRVPENSQKWQPTEPRANKFVFANPDRVALTSEANGQMLRCHTLTWHSQLPDFGKSPSIPSASNSL